MTVIEVIAMMKDSLEQGVATRIDGKAEGYKITGYTMSDINRLRFDVQKEK